jgi:hypothetical protein
MTTVEKNIEIAKMIGWKYDSEFGYKTNNNSFGDGYYNSDQMKFHSDANWQFNALNYILKNGLGRWFIGWNITIINIVNKGVIKPQVRIENENPRKAVFEALFQFSQYLKEKK